MRRAQTEPIAQEIREAFLARSEASSGTRQADEVTIEVFSSAGLGEHPVFLAFLSAAVGCAGRDVVSYMEFKKAKRAAYRLLRKQLQGMEEIKP